MKNVVIISSLILTAGYPAVVAILGLFSVTVPSLLELAGINVALGIVAFALSDYGRRPHIIAPALDPDAPQREPTLFVQAAPLHVPAASTELKAA